MPVDPQMQAILDLRAALPPIHTLPVADARAEVKGLRPPGLRIAVVASIADRAIPGPSGPLGLRIYTPPGTGPFPLLVFFHGGGSTPMTPRAATSAPSTRVTSCWKRPVPGCEACSPMPSTGEREFKTGAMREALSFCSSQTTMKGRFTDPNSRAGAWLGAWASASNAFHKRASANIVRFSRVGNPRLPVGACRPGERRYGRRQTIGPAEQKVLELLGG